jgi:hypothetical protein
MLEEIELLLGQAIKQFILKPELLITELHQLYVIYKDLKGLLNGQTNSSN